MALVPVVQPVGWNPGCVQVVPSEPFVGKYRDAASPLSTSESTVTYCPMPKDTSPPIVGKAVMYWEMMAI